MWNEYSLGLMAVVSCSPSLFFLSGAVLRSLYMSGFVLFRMHMLDTFCVCLVSSNPTSEGGKGVELCLLSTQLYKLVRRVDILSLTLTF